MNPNTTSAVEPRIARALEHLSSLLIPNEKLEAYAIQRRLFALLNRRSFVAATTGRFIGMSRGIFGGFTPADVRWQDLKDARIQVGIFGATITIVALSSPDLAISGSTRTLAYTGLQKADAQAVYRICQANEQAWREKRRLRELEELRAKSGGIQFGPSQTTPMSLQPPPDNGDATTRLQRAKDMLDKKLISDSEYETVKAKIISSL